MNPPLPQTRWRGFFASCRAYTSYIVAIQKHFWGVMVKETWGKLSLTEKLVWFFFFNQTIAIITLIELLLLKH
jgi:hypothetical protein